MITQAYKQGEHTIKIESAESLEDMKKNDFKEGEYHRYYVDGKLTGNYMAMIRFIVDESKKNQTRLIPSGPSLETLRKEMIQRQDEAIHEQLNKIRKEYSQMVIPSDILKKSNDFINKIDPLGMRIKE